MKIISANWIITCDKNNSIIENGAVVFDETIIEIDTLENIEKKYPTIEIEKLDKNSVLMPGLINSHVHLEFSSNSTTLKYGNFMSWLNSVIRNRDDLINKAKDEIKAEKIVDYSLKENIAERVAKRLGASVGLGLGGGVSSFFDARIR
jgi:cytosine/adenosine deaminase-related metal-dependent hydrolase